MKYKGFSVTDTAEPYYELLYLPFTAYAPKPSFKQFVKAPGITEQGFVLYYAYQCPFTAKYVPLMEEIAKAKSIPFKAIRFKSMEEAQNAPVPFTSYSLFHNSIFETNEILSAKKFENLVTEKGYIG